MVSGFSLRRMAQYAGGSGSPDGASLKPVREEAMTSPYKLVSSFGTSGQVEAFELASDRLYVATPNAVSIYDTESRLVHNFPVPSQVRDMIVRDDKIYLLYPSHIEIYTTAGDPVREWDACSESSDYCSFAWANGDLFVTDVAMKNICQYTDEGHFVRFIESPNRFVIPSYTFGIEAVDNVIYCSNSGRHLIESYSTDGEYLGAFGKPGGVAGHFAGCCNPVHLSYSPTGELITSEKGNPRISCYSRDGEFRSVLLDSKALGGGRAAYDVKLQDDKMYVAGNGMVSVFRYDALLAANTGCAGCGVTCPLRKGITIS